MEQCIPSKNNVEEAFATDELALSINAFLATCSEDQRNIFVRRYWYFDTVAEISKKYGYSQSKVKTALFRMREGLKQHLENEGQYDLNDIGVLSVNEDGKYIFVDAFFTVFGDKDEAVLEIV